MIHFVGFKDDRIWNARRVWGEPDFYHRNWDQRAWQEVVPGDVAVFASEVVCDRKTGEIVVKCTPDEPPRPISWDDSQQDILAYGGKGFL